MDIYFENGGKNVSFKIEEDSVCLKCTEIRNKMKSILNVKFHSQPIYDDKCIKSKVKTFNNTIIHSSQEMKSLKKKLILFVFQQFVLIQY